MSALAPGSPDPIQLALGQDALDRRADLRFVGWDAVPAERVLVLLDPQGDVAIHRGTDRDAVLALVDHGPRPDPEHDLLLGVDATGRAVSGRVVQRDAPEVPADVEWAGLRAIGLRLPPEQRSFVVELAALANWHRTHTRCPRCGAVTGIGGLGWWRTCPEDGSAHYPRTDPAVIALLVDDAGNALLGRQATWPDGAFSTLAGFVEPGESAESAVRRELTEEVGLTPGEVHYAGSQPWPFPGSLMLGFRASIDGVRPEPAVDGVEIVEARWLARDELPAACEAREVRLPGRLSIAHALVRQWYGADIPDAWCRW